MKIQHETVNSVLYIGMTGELDEHTAVYAREFLDTLIENDSIKKVVMDLSELSFMDSTGIGVLIGRFKTLKSRSIPIMIANPSRVVDKILTLSGMYELMPKVVY